MRRLATVEHIFTLKIDPAVIKKIRVIYSQNNSKVLVKESPDIRLSGNVATVYLTQEDTKKFDDTKMAEIQVRVLTADDKSLSSGIFKKFVGRSLDDEVMV